MSEDREPEAGQNARLIRALIWAGVGMASVAAAVVLLGGSDDSVRFAVVLIAVCVLLLGASMLVRSDPVLLRMEVEDRVAAEIDRLRDGLCKELAVPARATQTPPMQGRTERVRAVAGVAVPPRQRGSASVPPPMAPVFRAPTPAPPRGGEHTGVGTQSRTGVYGATSRPHKRRADVTAVDLGYTGRRSRPDHASPDPVDEDDEDGYWRRLADGDRW